MSSHAQLVRKLTLRNMALQHLRQFMYGQGFAEIDPAILQKMPGMEAHLQAFSTTLHGRDWQQEAAHRFLHTSPEIALKKIMAQIEAPGGEQAGIKNSATVSGEISGQVFSKIFSLGHVFRNGEIGPLHHPEFTMLEWYARDGNLQNLVRLTQALMRNLYSVLQNIDGGLQGEAPARTQLVRYQNHHCDIAQPWQWHSIADLFFHHAACDILSFVRKDGQGDTEGLRHFVQKSGLHTAPDDNWDDLFHRMMLAKIEPHLGQEQVAVVTGWPAPLGLMAQIDPDDSRIVRRAEIYCAGVELANGFEETHDANLLRQRIESQQSLKSQRYGARWPVDEEFLSLVSDLPPCAGMALGFDRLLMLLCGARNIQEVIW